MKPQSIAITSLLLLFLSQLVLAAQGDDGGALGGLCCCSGILSIPMIIVIIIVVVAIGIPAIIAYIQLRTWWNVGSAAGARAKLDKKQAEELERKKKEGS